MVWVGAVLLVVFVFALLCALWVVWLVVMLFVFALWFDRFNSVVTCDSLCLYVCAFCCPVMVAICCRAGLGCWFLFLGWVCYFSDWFAYVDTRVWGLVVEISGVWGWWPYLPVVDLVVSCFRCFYW